MAVVAMKQLLEAGVHFGHQTRRWDPKMAEYIFQARNGIHIIDLQKTSKKIDEAYDFMRSQAEEGKKVLFVGTKKQAQECMKEAAEKSGCGVCLMHMQGEPRTMQKNPVYNDLMAEVKSFLAERAQALRDLGVPAERIVLDPGFGFGKTVSQNFELLAKTEDFLSLGYPLLYGMSRKSSLGAVTGVAKAEERLISSVTAHLLAVERGASIVRVHDVKQMKEALTVYNAMIHYKDLK